MKDTILFGDVKRDIKCISIPQSARTCVTSPPYYGLRDYGGEVNQIGQEQTWVGGDLIVNMEGR